MIGEWICILNNKMNGVIVQMLNPRFIVIACILFSQSMYGQFHVSVSFFQSVNTYRVVYNPSQQFAISGFEKFREENKFTGYGMEGSLWYNYKESQNIRLDVHYTPVEAKVFFNEVHSLSFGRSQIPLNLKFAYLRSFNPTPEISLNFGIGLGARYFFRPFDNRNGVGVVASVQFNDADNNRITFKGDLEINQFSLYLPLYFGFEFQVVGPVRMFAELQIHRNLYPVLGTIDFEIDDTRQDEVIYRPKVTFGSFMLLDLGIKIDLQKRAKPRILPNEDFREKILGY